MVACKSGLLSRAPKSMVILKGLSCRLHETKVTGGEQVFHWKLARAMRRHELERPAMLSLYAGGVGTVRVQVAEGAALAGVSPVMPVAERLPVSGPGVCQVEGGSRDDCDGVGLVYWSFWGWSL